jgi:hypothetical protein
MDNSKPELPGSEPEPEPKPDAQLESQPESQPSPEAEAEPEIYVNEKIKQAFDHVKMWFRKVKDYYRRSPRLQKLSYQGKFLPAFWTVACIFSLLVNILLIALLISLGHHLIELKTLVANGLLNDMTDNLALMDKAHIVTTVPVETTVRLQDDLPVVFDLSIDQSTQLSLSQETRIPNAYIYLNNTAVITDLTLPAGTLIQANFDMTIPVSQTIPVDVTVPVSLLVPLDLAIDQTDLHQSIVGLQDAIEPYKSLMVSSFNSTKEISFCNPWWLGWMCNIFFGKP